VEQQQGPLQDRFGRTVDYVRISVTDRCDLRCVYCMEPDQRFVPRDQVLSLEEIARLGRAFTELGVRKIRLTGGEPLVRRNVTELCRELARLPGLDELVITTNGTQLGRLAEPLRAAGVKRLNISLDTLDAERFARITRTGELQKTLDGIHAARDAGFECIKLNSVILRNRNHDEVLDLADFALSQGMDISYIEEMPLGVISDHDRAEAYYSSDDIMDDLTSRYDLTPCPSRTAGPSRYYKVKGHANRIGFISPHSHNFCSSCNRVRVTAQGRLLLCLGQEHSMDLRAVLRDPAIDDAGLRAAIVQAMDLKPLGHDFSLREQPIILRHMNMTGG